MDTARPSAHATGDRWTLLIVLALAPDTARLSRLKERLPGISTGVLEARVQQMVALGLLSRRRLRETPPRVEIELTECGRELLPIASQLARSGMRHQWSGPRERERVHADALVRQLPALLGEEAGLSDGTVEAVIATDGDPVCHWFQIEQGRLSAMDGPCAEPTAYVEGDDAAWIAALGPARDRSDLRFKGERQLAKRLLDVLPERA
jgi:DNA-binding HxlR family transcriptional regulator